MRGGSPAWQHTPPSTESSLVTAPTVTTCSGCLQKHCAAPTDSLSACFFSGASIGDGQSAVASNIANTTYRLQWWDFTKFDLPEISNGTDTPHRHSFPVVSEAVASLCDLILTNVRVGLMRPSCGRALQGLMMLLVCLLPSLCQRSGAKL